MSRPAKSHESIPSIPNWYTHLFNLFNIRKDTDEKGTTDTIRNNVNFNSANAWMLVFAILIASVGLNLNSTAVIIGAMLISPLMGPIVGAGLSLGINDFPLLKQSIRNLLIAAGISVATSAVYFLLSPYSQAQSELLSRTKPTVYDLLIAIFGGMTGFIAASRHEKGTAIPGVAIATALMPPLCTAGWSLANGHYSYFLGAMYLFVINSVFICLSTYLFVRFLHFKKTTYINPERQKHIHRIMMILALVVFIPSVFLAWTFLTEESFRSKASLFVDTELHLPNTFVMKREFVSSLTHPKISLNLLGQTLTASQIQDLKAKLNHYGLKSADLEIHQSSLTQELERTLEAKLSKGGNEAELQARLNIAQSELSHYRDTLEISNRVKDEAIAVFQSIDNLIVFNFSPTKGSGAPATNDKSVSKGALIQWKGRPSKEEKRRLESFLQKRLEDNKLAIFETSSQK